MATPDLPAPTAARMPPISWPDQEIFWDKLLSTLDHTNPVLRKRLLKVAVYAVLGAPFMLRLNLEACACRWGVTVERFRVELDELRQFIQRNKLMCPMPLSLLGQQMDSEAPHRILPPPQPNVWEHAFVYWDTCFKHLGPDNLAILGQAMLTTRSDDMINLEQPTSWKGWSDVAKTRTYLRGLRDELMRLKIVIFFDPNAHSAGVIRPQPFAHTPETDSSVPPLLTSQTVPRVQPATGPRALSHLPNFRSIEEGEEVMDSLTGGPSGDHSPSFEVGNAEDMDEQEQVNRTKNAGPSNDTRSTQATQASLPIEEDVTMSDELGEAVNNLVDLPIQEDVTMSDELRDAVDDPVELSERMNPQPTSLATLRHRGARPTEEPNMPIEDTMQPMDGTTRSAEGNDIEAHTIPDGQYNKAEAALKASMDIIKAAKGSLAQQNNGETGALDGSKGEPEQRLDASMAMTQAALDQEEATAPNHPHPSAEEALRAAMATIKAARIAAPSRR
ncbi:hypothetical protein K490DRAFT_61893 [Saccharata proteae CBS 121410]|uniref:Uncharacterized protein n=1 Tax=Saccharata proteae CBS 121410 TaxID=1314787 RepID=A0A9P4I110_9PEZI|nr:hypothetical protein K490DRAFT_61893 [Saccharata proteae CBS 121410]